MLRVQESNLLFPLCGQMADSLTRTSEWSQILYLPPPRLLILIRFGLKLVFLPGQSSGHALAYAHGMAFLCCGNNHIHFRWLGIVAQYSDDFNIAAISRDFFAQTRIFLFVNPYSIPNDLHFEHLSRISLNNSGDGTSISRKIAFALYLACANVWPILGFRAAYFRNVSTVMPKLLAMSWLLLYRLAKYSIRFKNSWDV